MKAFLRAVRKGCLLLVILACAINSCALLYLSAGAGATMAGGTGTILTGLQVVENWLEGIADTVCGIVYLPWCGKGENLVRFYQQHLLNSQEKYIPVLPPPAPGFGENLIFPEGSLYRWFTVRGVTGYETRGVAVVIAVTPLSGTMPIVGAPEIAPWVSAPLVALSACYSKFSSAVSGSSDPDEFYAWKVVVNNARVIRWDWDETRRMPFADNAMDTTPQPYLCVVYRAPVEKESRLDDDASVYATLPSNPFLLQKIPASTPKTSIAQAINTHCQNQIAEALTRKFLEHILRNIGDWIRDIFARDTFRINHGQMQAICTMAITARYAQVLPTPTPTPTPTPIPTPTPTPSAISPQAFHP